MNFVFDTDTIQVERNGYVFQIPANPMSNWKFKGGGKVPPQPSPALSDTEIKKYARETLYPMVLRGMEGKGFGTAELQTQERRTLYGGLEKSYTQARGEFESQMARTLDPRDVRTKSYLSNVLSREYITRKDEVARAQRAEDVSDIDMSMGMAADWLASEKRMNIGGAEMYNRALAQNLERQQQAGTFGSNLASGIGTATGSLYGAYMLDQKYANTFAGN